MQSVSPWVASIHPSSFPSICPILHPPLHSVVPSFALSHVTYSLDAAAIPGAAVHAATHTSQSVREESRPLHHPVIDESNFATDEVAAGVSKPEAASDLGSRETAADGSSQAGII